MKIEQLKKRLDKNRPMTTISIRFPADVIEDLKKIAQLRGFSGYQPLIRVYVGQGLRTDLEHFENNSLTALVENLKKHGVDETIINEALNEVVHE
jgi:hypothetical protein